MTYFANRRNQLQIVSCRAFSASPRCKRASNPALCPTQVPQNGVELSLHLEYRKRMEKHDKRHKLFFGQVVESPAHCVWCIGLRVGPSSNGWRCSNGAVADGIICHPVSSFVRCFRLPE